MEQDRYQKNHVLYIIGLISLVASLSLLALTLYIIPHILFGWTYDVPSYVSIWKEWLRVKFSMNVSTASQLIALILFLITLLFAGIAYFTSNRMDNLIFSTELENKEQLNRMKKSHREAVEIILKLLLIVLLVYMLAELFLWLIK